MMRKLAASAICLAMLFAPSFPAGADEYSEINAVITEYSAEIEQIPGVGTMEIFKADDGTLAISINVVRVTPQLSEIPPVLGGFPVVFEKRPRPRVVEVLRGGKPSEEAVLIRSGGPPRQVLLREGKSSSAISFVK